MYAPSQLTGLPMQRTFEMQPHMNVTFCEIIRQSCMTMNFNIELSLVLSVMPVSGLAALLQ